MPLFPLEIVRELFSLPGFPELGIYLRDLLGRPEIAEAIRSVNEEFYQQLSGKDNWSQKEIQTLANYVLRMSYRPTPLGLMAGVARLNSGKENRFLKNVEYKLDRFTEAGALSSAEALAEFRRRPDKLSYLTNPSLIFKGHTCWFIDWKEKNGHRNYFRSKASLGQEGEELLSYCKTPRSFKELQKHFEVESDDLDSFRQFLEEYLSANLLETDLIPSLVSDKKTPLSEAAPKAGAFTQVRITLPENEISESQIHSLYKVTHGLYRISKVWNDRFSPWYHSLKDNFRSTFYGKYIPLLDFILLHLPETDERLEDDLLDSPKSKKWLELLSEAALLGKEEIALSEEMLTSLEISPPEETRGHPDPAYSVIYSLGKEGGKFRGKYIFGVQGWEGVRGYSRFSRLYDDITFRSHSGEKKKIYVDLEFYPGDVATGISRREQSISTFVRLSHLKAGAKRKYLDPAGIEITLQNDLFVLRCRETKKEIVPLMTSAHIVHAHGHPVFRFFGFVAAEAKKTFLEVPWLPDALTYIPAVSYRGYLLNSRRWKMRSEVLWAVAEDPELRRRMNIPRWIVVREQDNLLPIDLDSPVTPGLLRKYQADRPLKVEEEWHLNQAAHVEVGEKSFSHEVMLQWRAPEAVRIEQSPVISPPVKLSGKNDKITEYRFYVPTQLLDSFLLEVLIPLARKLKRKKKIRGYYFVKFSHPSAHIRFRLLGADTGLWEAFHLKARQEGNEYLLSDSFETPFELELETYGGTVGLKSYLRLSSLLSESYPSYALVRSQLAGAGHPSYGNPVDLAYLILLFRQLLSHKVFTGYPKITEPDDLPGDVKKGRAHFFRHHSGLIDEKSLEAFVSDLVRTLHPVLNELDRNFREKKIRVSREMFLRRIIHMEVFRITDGSPLYIEGVAFSAIRKMQK